MNRNQLATLSKQQLINKVISLDDKRRYGWSCYFGATSEAIDQHIQMYNMLDDILKSSPEQVDVSFIRNKLLDMQMKYENDLMTCGICDELVTDKNNGSLLFCGHLYHKDCLQKWRDQEK